MMSRDRFDVNQEAGWSVRFDAAERARKKRERRNDWIEAASALVIAAVIAAVAVVLVSGAGY